MGMKNICLGILAHVDAGKTSLCESLLYKTASIRSAGRVDHGDSFLDTDSIERQRGITVYTKTAVFTTGDLQVQLVDTPGHVDFSAETERCLRVLDYALLLVSATSGVQSHTRTLFHILERYKVPCLIFVNKMDIFAGKREELLAEIKSKLASSCTDFANPDGRAFAEELALSGEELMNRYLAGEKIGDEDIAAAVGRREIFPVFWGSALRNEGIEELLSALERYSLQKKYGESFSALVYKISRDKAGTRLSHVKVLGDSLKAKQSIGEEKVNQIRLYKGEKYESPTEVQAGSICVLTGLQNTFAGQYIGEDRPKAPPVLEPVLRYRMLPQEGTDIRLLYPKLQLLNEEEPELQISYDGESESLHISLMGEVQLEIIQSKIKERFAVDVSFSEGHIVYKESIKGEVLGLGHFEPLKHYAEVHLHLEEGEPGSGIRAVSDLDPNLLPAGSGNSLLSFLEKNPMRGVLIGAKLTDVKVRLKAAKLHQKHSEGGDLREAALRAFRQGLLQARSVILEPYSDFELFVPTLNLGRSLNDLNAMHARMEPPLIRGEEALIKGRVPLVNIQNYHSILAAYSKGEGSLSLRFAGYEECHNAQEVLAASTYLPLEDMEYPASSVFCARGESFLVEWDQVQNYVHLPLAPGFYSGQEEAEAKPQHNSYEKEKADAQELMDIFERTYGKIKPRIGDWDKPVKKPVPEKEYVFKKTEKLPEYILVDAYNVIFAWQDLKELAALNIDSARDKLMDMLSAYAAYVEAKLILVFDAYKVQAHKTEVLRYHNIDVVYTKTAETADQYIEKTAQKMSGKYRVSVVTSDALEQIIIRSQGCTLIGSREFYQDMQALLESKRKEHRERRESGKSYLFDGVEGELKEQLEDWRLGRKED